MPTERQWNAARARARMNAALRSFFTARGYLEVETPALVPAPGQEPHITPFTVPFTPETDRGHAKTLYLHTSPEYAMKRLLAEPGCPPLFSLCKVFRNGEVSQTHNPEFTLLEFYRPNADYHALMDDTEALMLALQETLSVKRPFVAPFERLPVKDAVRRYSGVDLDACGDAASLRAAAERAGVRVGGGDSWDDVFFHLFLQKVEPKLGVDRPTFLIEYPAAMASLSRLKPGDPSVAERVELFAGGFELANGFSELTDGAEQRKRLVEEQSLRKREGRLVPPLDERFLAAVGKMPEATGIAIGIDRVLMLLLGEEQIADVLLFPAHEFIDD